MGGGSCNTIYFVNGSVAHTSVIPVGGQHFTHDIAVGLRTPQVSAEELKKKYSCALASLVNEQETIEVEGVGGRKPRTVLRKDLAEVVEPRAEETLQLIHIDLQSSQLMGLLGSGLVLTGGASELDGLIEMGEFIFDIPVRRGVPQQVGGLMDVVKSAAYATSVGLILYGAKQDKSLRAMTEAQDGLGDSLNEVGRKVRSFFGDLF
jgi:cell division protein FtsA